MANQMEKSMEHDMESELRSSDTSRWCSVEAMLSGSVCAIPCTMKLDPKS